MVVFLLNVSQRNEDTNVFISPFSITMALAMTYAGSLNNTAEELRKSAKFDCFDSKDDVHSTFSHVLQSLAKDGNILYALEVANAMYVKDSYQISKDFQSILKDKYKSEVKAANFQKDSAIITEEINKWVSTVTKNKITNLLSPGAINTLTSLIIINAIYFKGNWKNKFDPKDTSKGNFLIRRETTIQTEFIRKFDEDFAYAHNDELMCKIIEFPYNAKRLSMYVILPDEVEGLSNLENKLTATHFNSLKSSLRWSKVMVAIPKFKLEFDVDLNPIFCDLGVQQLFIPNKADLSGISPDGQLYVSNIIHKAFVDVTEDGTEAAAATAAANSFTYSARQSAEFHADHPFLFVIYDKLTDFILFMGRFTNPPC